MKRSKREESSIVIYFSFYLILSLTLLIFFFVSLYPKLGIINDQKESTLVVYNQLEKTKNTGISFGDFKKMTSTAQLNSYQTELMKSIDVDFYNSHLINNDGDSYEKFLEKKNNELATNAEIQKYSEKEEQIIKLLPIYSESSVNGEDNLLSDFKFINYIENILATFSLEYDNEIGISDLVLLDGFSDETNKSQLVTDIYYIPLDLKIEGTKYNIINFLYFIQNVGNISIVENRLDVHDQNKDKFLYRTTSKILLKNDVPKSNINASTIISNYNIFENQLIDIQSIDFGGYLDEIETPTVLVDESIADRVKETQGNSKISIDLSLRFYVKGVQNIKIIQHIQSYIDYLNTTKTLVAKQMGNKTLDTRKQIIVKNIQSDVNEMTKSLKDINISISKQENLNETLKDVYNYTNILHSMHNKMGYNVYIINFLNEYKKLSNDSKIKETNTLLFNYLVDISEDIDEIKQEEGELLINYEERLNKKSIFEDVIKMQKNIKLKQ